MYKSEPAEEVREEFPGQVPLDCVKKQRADWSQEREEVIVLSREVFPL